MSESSKPPDLSFFFVFGMAVGFLLATALGIYSTHYSSLMSRYCVATDANGSQRCVSPEQLDALLLRAFSVPQPQEPK